jgi:iron complex outermembrane recepter protein
MLSIGVFSAGLLQSGLFAQAASSSEDRAETVELSPFVVDAASDSGYAATQTLAGTRMRTNLKDVGASLNVLTPEFLQDLALNSLDAALIYTPSVDTN